MQSIEQRLKELKEQHKKSKYPSEQARLLELIKINEELLKCVSQLPF